MNATLSMLEAQKAELQAEMAKHLEGLVGKVPGLLTAKFVCVIFASFNNSFNLN